MRMTPAKFEKTAMDRKMDKAHAKKAGVSVKKWEGSAADKKADAQALRKMNKGIRATTKNKKY